MSFLIVHLKQVLHLALLFLFFLIVLLTNIVSVVGYEQVNAQEKFGNFKLQVTEYQVSPFFSLNF